MNNEIIIVCEEVKTSIEFLKNERLSDWEYEFIDGIIRQLKLTGSLSKKQWDTVLALISKFERAAVFRENL